MSERLKEKCGVFGAYNVHEAARLTYFGLIELQHRGQESSGIAVFNSEEIVAHKGMGLVSHLFTEEIIGKLDGKYAIGHNRYSTSKTSSLEHTQPFSSAASRLALAHNGNLPTTKRLEEFLDQRGLLIKDRTDSRLMHDAIKYFIDQNCPLESAVRECYPLFTGAFSMLVMHQDTIAAVRDSYGIRPLSIGKLNGGFIFSSETCALDTVGAQFIRDVQPGEMVIAQGSELTSHKIDPNDHPKLDAFEFVYFSRPDSRLLGRSVYQVRERLGQILAQEQPVQADIIVPILQSSTAAALGYGYELGIRYQEGLVKNNYIGRTFIQPTERLRRQSVRLKHNPVPDLFDGKRVVLIDDSLVRNTTLPPIAEMIWAAGAKEVHVRIASPPVRFPNIYGINTKRRDELACAVKSIEEVRQEANVTSLGFLSFDGLIQGIGVDRDYLCTSDFNGDYPIDLGESETQRIFAEIM